MIKVNNRDGSVFDNIAEYKYSEFDYWSINKIEIEGNPDKYLGKIFYIYDLWNLIGSWIAEKYSFNKNTNIWQVELYPLYYDLRKDFLDTGTPGQNIVYLNDTFENVLTYVINQYRSKVTNPLLYLKSPLVNSGSTGINIKYTFNNKTFLECWNTLILTFLPMEKNVFVHPDGGIEIINVPDEKKLIYWNDVQTINYNKKTDEIINYIIFDNKLSWTDHIYKTYQDAASITAYWKRVKYWDDQRVKYETTADEMVNAYLTKYKDPIIEIEDIKTTNLNIWIYNKITINNWDKTFDDNIFVVWVSYIKWGLKNLKLWTKLTRSVLSREDDADSVSEALDYITQSIPTLPDYIQETYIDSTEIRSPNIAGNAGYFSNQMRVWPSGIVIDGINKLIKSNNYAAGSAGWQIDNAGNAEFNDATLRGDFVAWSININNNFTVDGSGNARGNDLINKTIFFEKLGSTPEYADGKMWCEGNPTNKVLWGYFWGDGNKQQVSTSRMQYSNSFDRTSSTSYTYSTWFQPRLVIFNGFFENTASQIYWTTNGQAGSVASSQGFCNCMSLEYGSVTGITGDLSFSQTSGVISNLSIWQWGSSKNFHYSNGACNSKTDWCVTGLPQSWSWTNNSVLSSYSFSTNSIPIIQQIKTANVTDAFAADSITKNAYAYVSSWSDTGITIQVVVPSGWRLCWNITIFW